MADELFVPPGYERAEDVVLEVEAKSTDTSSPPTAHAELVAGAEFITNSENLLTFLHQAMTLIQRSPQCHCPYCQGISQNPLIVFRAALMEMRGSALLQVNSAENNDIEQTLPQEVNSPVQDRSESGVQQYETNTTLTPRQRAQHRTGRTSKQNLTTPSMPWQASTVTPSQGLTQSRNTASLQLPPFVLDTSAALTPLAHTDPVQSPAEPQAPTRGGRQRRNVNRTRRGKQSQSTPTSPGTQHQWVREHQARLADRPATSSRGSTQSRARPVRRQRQTGTRVANSGPSDIPPNTPWAGGKDAEGNNIRIPLSEASPLQRYELIPPNQTPRRTILSASRATCAPPGPAQTPDVGNAQTLQTLVSHPYVTQSPTSSQHYPASSQSILRQPQLGGSYLPNGNYLAPDGIEWYRDQHGFFKPINEM